MSTGAFTAGTFAARYALSLSASMFARTSPYSPPILEADIVARGKLWGSGVVVVGGEDGPPGRGLWLPVLVVGCFAQRRAVVDFT